MFGSTSRIWWSIRPHRQVDPDLLRSIAALAESDEYFCYARLPKETTENVEEIYFGGKYQFRITLFTQYYHTWWSVQFTNASSIWENILYGPAEICVYLIFNRSNDVKHHATGSGQHRFNDSLHLVFYVSISGSSTLA